MPATTEPTRPRAADIHSEAEVPIVRGACVGRFILVEQVGAGGGGQVWRAFDPELDRTIAIKLLHGQSGGIVTEAQALAKLGHPNVARIHDVGTVQLDRLYTFLAVEFVEGPTLEAFCRSLRKQGGQARRIVRTFIELGRGLAAVHDEGLVHRDFKPTNALINPKGRPVLVDFGLAQPELGPPESQREASMLAAGTLGYMPPEQHRGMAVSAASDTYAFCAALWEALSGALPFAATTSDALLDAKLAGVDQGATPAGIPRRVSNVLVRGLHPDASERFTDTRSLLRALERANAIRRWPGVVLGGAVVGVALFGVAAQTEPCQEDPGATWTDARRAKVEASMLSVDVPYGRHVTRNTIASLGRWAETWSSSRRGTCMAAHAGGSLGEGTFTLQAACYDRALSRFDAVLDVLEASDVASIHSASDLLAELHAPTTCEDGPGLRASGSFESRGLGDALTTNEARGLLDGVDVNRASGRLQDAQRLLEQAREVSEPLHNPALLASVELAAGQLALAHEDHGRAESLFRNGLALALEAGDWSQVHGASVALIDLVGEHLGRTREALRYREFAEQLIEGDPRAKVETLLALGGTYRRAGDHDEALLAYNAALALQTELHGEDSLEAAIVYSELGTLLAKSQPQRGLELAQRTYDIREQRLGEGHPSVTMAGVRLAWSLAALGRFTDQLDVLERALRFARQTPGSVEEAEVAHALGGALMQAGRCEEAKPLVLRAVELGSAHGGEPDLRLAGYLFHLGALELCEGRYEEAQAELERVLEIRTSSSRGVPSRCGRDARPARTDAPQPQCGHPRNGAPTPSARGSRRGARGCAPRCGELEGCAWEHVARARSV